MAIQIGFGLDSTKAYQSTEGTQTQQRILSQDAVDKILKDVLGGDQGLASLAQGENVSGLSGTSVKTMLAQDLVTKIVGQIAEITAPVVTQSDQRVDTGQTKKSGGLKTVICTELLRQGKLDICWYEAGENHFLDLSPVTVRGYRVWANRVAEKMKTSERLSNFFVPIVEARYRYITGKGWNLLGALTVYVGQPLCFVIGLFVRPEACYAHTDA